MKLQKTYNPYKFIFVLFSALTLFPVFAASHWREITEITPSFDNDYWLDVYFLEENPNFGWICGYNGRTLRTTDGGQTWLGTSIFAVNQLESIHFANERVGYVSGENKIYKSTDGGANWTDVSDRRANSLWGNFFVDENTGLTIGGGCSDFEPQQFFRTTNGGDSWTLFEADVPETGLTDLIVFDRDGLGYASSSGLIWRTTNGGRTWEVMAQSGDRDWQEEISVYGSSFLVPYSGYCTGGGPGGMRFSTDGGNSWIQYETGEPMFGTFLFDERRGWACGWAQGIFYTTDGGLDWELDNCGIPEGVDLDDIWFWDDSTGFVVGAGIYEYYKADPPNPSIVSRDDLIICEGDSVVLSADSDYFEYRWSTGETTKSIVVKQSGVYTFTAWANECDSAASNGVKVKVAKAPRFDIYSASGEQICEGDSAKLNLIEYGDNEYAFVRVEWSDGDTNRTKYVKTEGEYRIAVYNEFGCKAEKSIFIEVLPNPKPEILIDGSPVYCVGDTTFLEVLGNYESYEWRKRPDDGSPYYNGKRITVTETGSYYAIARTAEGCVGYSDTVDIEVLSDSNRFEIGAIDAPDEFFIDSTRFNTLNCKNLLLRNTSDKEVVLEDAYLFRNMEFSVPQSVFPIVIPPFETDTLLVCFTPTRLDEERDTLALQDVCGIHLKPLVSWGKPNIYDDKNRCDATVEIRTYALGPNYFGVLKPRPNPSKYRLWIDFFKTSQTTNISETAFLIDRFGRIVAEAKVSAELLSSESGDGGETFNRLSGSFEFDLSQVSSGAYTAVIRGEFGSSAFPVLVQK